MTRKQKKNLIRIITSLLITLAVYLIVRFETVIPWWGALILYAIPYIIVGYDIAIGAIKDIVHGQIFGEKLLMLIATIGAFVLGDYLESVAVMLFFQIGELFQSFAVGKSRRSIATLMDIMPEKAVILRGGEEIPVSPEEVKKGELIIVKPGEKVPLDGIITKGNTALNQSALTGESLPIDKKQGDEVLSGTLNLSGVIEVYVTGEHMESTAQKIIELVENSASKKAKTENFITKFAKYYTPSVVVLALLMAIVPSIIDGMWTKWIHRAFVFLVVSCPCALVISIPLTFFGGIGGASKRGILFKGANYVETLAKTTKVIFDKTGTLTNGIIEVSNVFTNDISEEELIYFASLAESFSSHPIAKAIVNYYGKPIDKTVISDVKERAGFGVEGKLNHKSILVGNGRLLNENGIDYAEIKNNETAVYVAFDGRYIGCITVSDKLKNNAKSAIKELKKLNIKQTIMLTGDKKEVGEAIGKQLEMDLVKSELLPSDKVSETEKLMSANEISVYVGDGINDAPVLMRADIGVAMGKLGSDSAIEASDIVIVDDNLSKIAEGIRISRRTMRIVWENIIFALAVKVVVLCLSALGIVGMWSAVFADVGVSVIAILNAMRALKTEKTPFQLYIF